MADTTGKNRKLLKRAFSILVLVLVLAAFDQFTKALCLEHLKGEEPFVLLPGILELRYVENTGAAFCILKGRTWLFYILAPVVSALLIYAAMRLPDDRRYRPLILDLSFIAAGAIGNLIDRVRFSYVVDFIYFRLIDFPVFNVADIYITCACVLLAFLMLFYYKDSDFGFL